MRSNPKSKIQNPKLKVWWRLSGFTTAVSCALVLAAAWNTGFNLLYLVFGGLASFLILSRYLSRRNLRGLAVRLDAPDAIYRNDKLPVTIRIENRKKTMPSIGVRVAMDAGPGPVTALAWKIPPRGAARARLDVPFKRRGVYPLPPVQLISSFPFGLSEKRLTMPNEREVTVYPRVRAVRPAILQRLTGPVRTPRIIRGDGDEFFGLRDYVPGDDVRQIAWRVSARRRTLVVRETARQTSRFVVIVLDTRLPSSAPETNEDTAEAFEEAVDMAASLAVTFLNQHYSVAIATPDEHLPQGEGAGHVRKILEMLARVKRIDEPGSFDWFSPREDYAAASPLFVAADRALWGQRARFSTGRALLPSEVLRA